MNISRVIGGVVRPGLVTGQISSYFKYSKWGITTMPTIFNYLVVWIEWVGGFLGC